MKKLYLLLVSLISVGTTAWADSYTITISGLSYTPATLNANVGDEITIDATGTHPLRQVSEATWDAAGTTQLPGGFGTETTSYTFTITSPDDIYYICVNHVQAGMKGKIVVSTTTGIEESAGVAELQLFPNPVVGGEVTVSSNEVMTGTEFQLYNMNGQLVKTLKLNGLESKLQVSVADGVYHAIIAEADQALIRKRLVFVSE